MLTRFKLLFLILISASVFALFSTAAKLKNISYSKISSYRSSGEVKMSNKREESIEKGKSKNMQGQDAGIRAGINAGKK